jgi:hypothetical protein
MASWQNGKLTKWQVGKMASWQNGKLAKWQFDKMASSKMAIRQNGNLTKCQVGKMSLHHQKISRKGPFLFHFESLNRQPSSEVPSCSI